MTEEIVIRSSKSKCTICKTGDLVPEGEPTVMIIYTRNGIENLKHQYVRCNNRSGGGSCRASHNLGFVSLDGIRIYHDDALKEPYLITSNQTGFAMDFLVETVGQMDICNDAFEGLAKHYNRFHVMKFPFDLLERRAELNSEALNDAFFLYTYLEVCQRYEIPDYQIIESGLDNAILEKKCELMKKFRIRHTVDHDCYCYECKADTVTIDADLKVHRKVCKVCFYMFSN